MADRGSRVVAAARSRGRRRHARCRRRRSRRSACRAGTTGSTRLVRRRRRPAAMGCRRGHPTKAYARFTGCRNGWSWFAVRRRAAFYNDTTATTPESTMAAFRVARRTDLAAGRRRRQGRGFPSDDRRDCRKRLWHGVSGQMGPLPCHALLSRRDHPCVSTCCETLNDALAWCFAHSRPGESIVLSPACTSHDQFRNFHERGEVCVELVSALAQRGNPGSSRLNTLKMMRHDNCSASEVHHNDEAMHETSYESVACQSLLTKPHERL